MIILVILIFDSGVVLLGEIRYQSFPGVKELKGHVTKLLKTPKSFSSLTGCPRLLITAKWKKNLEHLSMKKHAQSISRVFKSPCLLSPKTKKNLITNAIMKKC